MVNLFLAAGVVAALALLSLALVALPEQSAFRNSALDVGALSSIRAQGVDYLYTQQKDTLSVTGQATLTADPDEVRITLGAITESDSAADSQQENADIMAAVRTALAAAGITEDDLSTVSYAVSPLTTYNDDTRRYETTGYQTTHLLLVKVTDIDSAGAVIDAAAQAGANSISSIQFTLSDNHQKEMQLQALEEATENAKQKADAIGSALGVSLVKPTHVDESFVSITPYYYQRGYGLAAESAAPTEISPGDVSVSASVSVVYEIG